MNQNLKDFLAAIVVLGLGWAFIWLIYLASQGWWA